MRTFNYTGRKKIERENISISIVEHKNSILKLTVDLDLSSYGFNVDSLVYLENQKGARFSRILLSRYQPRIVLQDVEIDQIEDLSDLQLFIKVVDPNSKKLIGLATRIKLDLADNKDGRRVGIFEVKSIDLTSAGVLWRVDCEDGIYTLQLEKELGPKESVVRGDIFRQYILPAAAREVFLRIIHSGDWSNVDNPDEASNADLWMKLAGDLGVGPFDRDHSNDTDLVFEWVDEVIRLLGNRIGARRSALEDKDL